MSRKIVFVNGESETLTIETNPYIIIKLEGLGIPSVNRQEQKAPYQDGTTYIDSLLGNRDIVVEIGIVRPNDFADIATYRRELSQRLCPKYGQGTLTYTDEAGNSYAITAVPYSIVFPNKDYRDPYARAQITFTANDPYWREVTGSTISLPTSVTSAESVITTLAAYSPSIIELSNGNKFMVYERGSDSYIVSRTYTTSWGPEVVVNAAISKHPRAAELSNGNIIVVYRRESDGYLIGRTYTTSWGAEVVINPAASDYPSVIEKINGNIFVLYSVIATSSLATREYTTSWSSPTVLSGNPGALGTCMVQKSNGDIVISYILNATTYLVYREYTTSWSAEKSVNDAASDTPSLILKNDGTIVSIYINMATAKLVSRELYDTVWTPESVVSPSGVADACAIESPANSLFMVYRKLSDSYLYSISRTVVPVPAVVNGDVPTPVKLTFNGPSVNPRIINQNTLEYIRLNATLNSGDVFVADTSFGSKTIILTTGGVPVNGIAYLDITSTFFQISRGSNTVYYEDDSMASTATATMEWTERYVGV